MLKIKLILFLLLTSVCAFSQEVILDNLGFVRAYYNLSEPQTATLFTWTASPKGYGRTVQVFRVKSPFDLSKLSPSSLKNYWEKQSKDIKSLTVLMTEDILPKSETIFGEKIELPLILSTLRQLHSGAAKFHQVFDPTSYISEHNLKLTDYTRAMNINLTRTYGAEFSSQIFKQLLLREPETEESMKIFTSLISQNLDKSEIRFDDSVELWVAKGIMQNTSESVEKVKGMFEKVLALMVEKGLTVKTFRTRTGDTVQVNAEIVAKTLKESASQRKKVIILAVSKAVPEVLGGLALLNKENFFRGQNKDLVKGAILTAGPQAGMHFADFSSMPVIFNIIRGKMTDMAAANKVDISNLRNAFKSLGHKNLGAYYESILPDLPHITYVNLIGISKAGNGYAEFRPLREMQEGLFNRWFFPTHGANDGIVEYDGLVRTGTLGPKGVTVVADGDHCIFPCEFKGREVNSNEEQMKSFMALFQFIDIMNARKGNSCQLMFQ